MRVLLDMYVTLFPVILAGVMNMVFVKLPILDGLKRPIDRNLKLSDGRRLFGNNKTWKGFWGMIALGGLFMVVWGILSAHNPALFEHNLFYRFHANTWAYNLFIGLTLGAVYVIFELPNSALKRRLGIGEGQTPAGPKGIPFGIFDQIDSLLGCVLVVSLFYPMTLLYYLAYVALGGITHIVFNVLLFWVKLKREI